MELTPHHFNPAGRLYEFLRYSKTKSRVPISQVWAGYLQVEEYSVAFFAGLGEVLSLPQQSRDGFRALPSSAKQYIDEGDVTAALNKASGSLGSGSKMLHGSIDEFKRLYGDDVVAELKNLSNFLRGEFQGRAGDAAAIEVAAGTLQKVRDLAEDLIAELEEDDELSADLRLLLLNQALAFRRAASLVRAGGFEAVGVQRDRAVGLIVAHPTVAAELRRKPKLRDRLLALITTAGVVASAFVGVIAAAEEVEHLVKAFLSGSEDLKSITDALPTIGEGDAPPATEISEAPTP